MFQFPTFTECKRSGSKFDYQSNKCTHVLNYIVQEGTTKNIRNQLIWKNKKMNIHIYHSIWTKNINLLSWHSVLCFPPLDTLRCVCGLQHRVFLVLYYMNVTYYYLFEICIIIKIFHYLVRSLVSVDINIPIY